MDLFKSLLPSVFLLISGCGVVLITLWKDIKQKNNELNEEVKDIYETKKRQDGYDAIPTTAKRQWLRDYTNKKVPDLAKAAPKKRD